MIERGETKLLNTVTVLRSSSVATPDGQVAIVLETKEAGAIAFLVDERAIAALRRELAMIESFLQQKGGTA
jgi:hypothetical protein